MPVESEIIRLLLDPKMEYFEDSLVFRTMIKDNPEAAKILADMMVSETPEIASRAGEMISLFSSPGLKPVVQKLSEQETNLRARFIYVAWAIIFNSNKQNYEKIFQDILPDLIPILNDKTLVDQKEFEEDVELEYKLRICDEAFLLLKYLQNPEYEEDLYILKNNKERDEEIRMVKNRFQPPIT